MMRPMTAGSTISVSIPGPGMRSRVVALRGTRERNETTRFGRPEVWQSPEQGGKKILEDLVSAGLRRTPWDCPDRDSGEFGSDAGAAALGEAGGFGAAAWVGQEGDAQPASARDVGRAGR